MAEPEAVYHYDIIKGPSQHPEHVMREAAALYAVKILFALCVPVADCWLFITNEPLDDNQLPTYIQRSALSPKDVREAAGIA